MADKPGMLNNAIKGFKATWTVVQSRRNNRGDVIGYSFTCGCNPDNHKFFKVRPEYDAHSHALAEVTRHKCPQQRQQAATAMRKIAKVA